MPFPDPPAGMPIDDLDDDEARVVALEVQADVVARHCQKTSTQGSSASPRPSTTTERCDQSNGRLVAIAWQFKTVPLPVTGLPERSVWIEGTTFVDKKDSDSPSEWAFARYIDWHSVFVDLGVAGAARIVAEDEQ